MAQPEDILVKILNLDVEIRYCMARLAEMEHGVHERDHPWIGEERSSLRARLERLKKRREVHFLILNVLVTRHAEGQSFVHESRQQSGTHTMLQGVRCENQKNRRNAN